MFREALTAADLGREVRALLGVEQDSDEQPWQLPGINADSFV